MFEMTNKLSRLKKNDLEKVERGITFLLLFYYLGFNIPEVATQSWAAFGFLAVPLLILVLWRRFFWVLTRDLPLLLLIIVVPISAIWSANPTYTLAYSRAFLCSTAFGIYLAARYSPKEQMWLLTWLFGISIFLNFLVPLAIPSYGIDGGWRGINRHKNELSGAMAISATFFLTNGIYSSRYRWIALTGAGFAFFILLLSQGKGSQGIFFLLLPLLSVYKIAQQEYRLKTFLGISSILIGGIIIVSVFVNIQFIVVELLGKDMGGNGRDLLWDYLINRGLERPWLGYGYGGFWTNPTEGLGVALKIPWLAAGGAGEGGGNAHSSYIDVFLQLGWLGLSLVGISFLKVLVRVLLLLGLSKDREYFWMLQCLLIIAITSIYESYGGFLTYRHLFWVLYVSHAYSSAIHLHRVFRTGNKFINIQAENSSLSLFKLKQSKIAE